MSMKNRFSLLFSIVIVLMIAGVFAMTTSERADAQEAEPDVVMSASQTVLDTAFTYQGRLTDGGNPADGKYDFAFTLYDAVTGGAPIGSPISKDDVIVTDGFFTIELDFGSSLDSDATRFLEVSVRLGNSTEAHTILVPRRKLLTFAHQHYSLSNADGTSKNALYINVDGKVGIGTTTPAEIMEIVAPNDAVQIIRGGPADFGYAALSLRGAVNRVNNDGGFLDFRTGNTINAKIQPFIGSAAGNARLGFFTANDGNLAEHMVTDQFGNVGINTTDPRRPLTVVRPDGANSGDYMVSFTNHDVDTDQGHGLLIQAGSSAADLPFVVKGRSDETLFRIRGNGGVEIGSNAVFDESGKVGIGTTNPSAEFEVVGDIKASETICDRNGCIGDKFSLWNTNSQGDVYVEGPKVGIGHSVPESRLVVRSSDSDAAEDLLVVRKDNQQGANRQFVVQIEPDTPDVLLTTTGTGQQPSLSLGAGSLSRAVTITTNGNVGIGTSSPGPHKLYIQGDSESNEAQIIIDHADDVIGPAGIRKRADGTLDIIANTTSDAHTDIVFWIGKNDSDRLMWIKDSGRVGIGTDSPEAKLDVTGNLKFTGQKVCRTFIPAVWSDTLLVPSSWSKETCDDLKTLTSAQTYQIGCIFENSVRFGADNGGIPSPNCGW